MDTLRPINTLLTAHGDKLAAIACALTLSLAACGDSDDAASSAEFNEGQPSTEFSEHETTPSDPEAKEAIIHTVTASVYWIGEEASADNGYISNIPSAWDSDTRIRFGGVDDPEGRDFEPLHNPFYFALPANEFTEDGPIPGARESSPWADQIAALSEGQSLFKGQWIELKNEDGAVVCAQWQDTGPFEEMDYDYVFGNELPKNTQRLGAGIDLSPDAANALGIKGGGKVSWRFVDASEVTEGPWLQHPAIDNTTYWE